MNVIVRRDPSSRAEPRRQPAGDADLFASLTLPAPADPGDVQRLQRELSAALAARGVRWREALLSADGRRLLCRWRGAPASVATVMGEAGFDAVQPWRGLALDLGQGTANVVVEDESTDGRPIRSIFPYDRLGPCLLAYRVTPVRVVISLDGCHLRAFYHAPDAESVRLAQRQGSVCPGQVRGFRDVTSA